MRNHATKAAKDPGGAIALFADGPVRILRDDTSRLVIWEIGSRCQGEVVGADSY